MNARERARYILANHKPDELEDAIAAALEDYAMAECDRLAETILEEVRGVWGKREQTAQEGEPLSVIPHGRFVVYAMVLVAAVALLLQFLAR